MFFTTAQVSISRRTHRFAVGAFFFLQGFLFASWASRIPIIQQQLGLSDGALGSILLALPMGLMTSLPLSGWLVGRFGSATILRIVAPLYALVLPLIGLVHHPWQLVGALFLFGTVGNIHNIAVNTQAVGVEELYQRSIMSSFHGLWSLAGFTAAALGSYFISLDLSTFTHFCINGAIALILMLLSQNSIMARDINQGTDQPLFAWPDRTLMQLSIVAFCSMICEGTMFDWSGVYFHKEVHAPESLTTLGYVAFMSTMAGGRFVGDWLAARIGTKRLVQTNGLLITTGLLVSVFFPYLVTATIGFLLVGMGVSTIVPLVYGAAGRSKTMSPGMALAAVSSVGFLGFLLGPPLIGFIAEAASLRWSFALVAVLGLCNSFLIGRVKT
ncbi:Fucose permease [Catalinimonas alkaloidigena]|uniref:Fucose permease n=1 Tax=Catalinimonas alkaloidigena TaxID=1075417 RepID=A0A1G9PJE6_9BACT|nr:MFS transporter [Catalinimonas alkaloidigena]SDL98928.1 Fucose permease [Catalinimonas alkaloidigena]